MKCENITIYRFDSDGNPFGSYGNYADAANSVGKQQDTLRKAIRLGTKCGGFYWALRAEPPKQFFRNDLEIQNRRPIGCNNKRATPIFQWDSSGRLVKKHPSTGVCAKSLGVPATTIQSRIHKKIWADGVFLTRSNKPPTDLPK